MLVCHCFKVYDAQIKKYNTLEEVRENTYATLGCGTCIPVVVDVLESKTQEDLNADLVQR